MDLVFSLTIVLQLLLMELRKSYLIARLLTILKRRDLDIVVFFTKQMNGSYCDVVWYKDCIKLSKC